VKKTLFVAGGILALGVLCYVGRLWAQQTPSTGPSAQGAPRTRIALINLTYVVKYYDKYKVYQEEMKGAIQPFQARDKEYRRQAEELAKSVPTPPPADKREEIEHKMKEFKRKIEDNDTEAKLAVSKKSDEQMKILYHDVVTAAQSYAVSRDFDLVLHYNDATTEEDFLSTQNIARKLQSGALMPLWAAQGMDISKEVVAMLNYKLSQNAAATPGAPTSSRAPAGHN
jgi:Skp family chaperone for outer membrane proteins